VGFSTPISRVIYFSAVAHVFPAIYKDYITIASGPTSRTLELLGKPEPRRPGSLLSWRSHTNFRWPKLQIRCWCYQKVRYRSLVAVEKHMLGKGHVLLMS